MTGAVANANPVADGFVPAELAYDAHGHREQCQNRGDALCAYGGSVASIVKLLL